MGPMSPKPDPIFSETSLLLRRSCSGDTLSSGDLKDGPLQVSGVFDSQENPRACRATSPFESA